MIATPKRSTSPVTLVPLRIGLNLLFLSEGTAGAGRYGRELTRALLAVEPESRITAFVGSRFPEDVLAEPWADAVEWVRLPAHAATRRHVAAQLAWIPALAARRRLDVVHSPANFGPLATLRCANVVTLLDLIWLHEAEKWEPQRRARLSMRLSLLCARMADRVLAISAAAKHDFVRTVGLDGDRIDVTPLGVRAAATVEPTAEVDVRARFALGNKPVVLSVAQKRPYKNLASLIRTTAELAAEEFVLVLPGAPTPHEAELRALAEALGVADRVRFLEWVSEPELDGLYGTATCFVLPSFIEGFGLPVLEAMARGVPVACSNRAALPEVAADAALLFDPEDQGAVTNAVLRLLRDTALRSELVSRGRRRCAVYTWERTAEATLASYRRAIRCKRRRRGPHVRGSHSKL